MVLSRADALPLSRAAELGDARWREVPETYQVAVERQLTRFRGHRVKTLGYGCLATFDVPARAIRCGHAITDAARASGLEVRVGVHTGELQLMGDDVGGIASTASRASERWRLPARCSCRARSATSSPRTPTRAGVEAVKVYGETSARAHARRDAASLAGVRLLKVLTVR